MGVPQPLLAVLRLIAGQLHGTSSNWAVTGSCSLALQGVPVAVHDIDLRTTAHDAYALESVFHSYQKRPVSFASSSSVQSHFGALEINGIQVEIIGDMQHRLPDGTWEPIVDMNRSKVWVVVDEIALPVMSLPFLYQAYQLLGRADKVAVLKNWLEDRKRRSPKLPPNRRLQLTAFGARDRWHFSALLCGAPRRQLKRKALGAGHRCCTYRKSKYYNHYALEADDDRHDQLLETYLGY